jgi:hypothetical protein
MVELFARHPKILPRFSLCLASPPLLHTVSQITDLQWLPVRALDKLGSTFPPTFGGSRTSESELSRTGTFDFTQSEL